MHTIFLGEIKTLFEYWFEKPANNKYSLKPQIHLIESRLAKILRPYCSTFNHGMETMAQS